MKVPLGWPQQSGRLYLANAPRMDPAKTLAIYDALAGDRLTFLYSGLFHDDHTARLITLGDEFLEQEGADKGMRGKLAFIMVEAYQNIIRHRAELPLKLERSEGSSIFLLRSRAGRHEITAINPVVRADAQKVVSALKGMDGLDLGQMKQAYLRGLQNEERTERGGAGLGLIEMSRRSGHPLRSGFEPLDEDHELFALQVLIGRSAKWEGKTSDAFDLHKVVVEQDISIICRGALAAGEQEVLMRIIERDLDEDMSRSSTRMRAFLAVTELLQNIGSAGEGPMIMVARSGAKVSLIVCAPLGNTDAEEFVRSIEEVNAMDDQSKQRRYRDILLGRGEDTGTLKLGLIDLARRSYGALKVGSLSWGNMPFVVLEATV